MQEDNVGQNMTSAPKITAVVTHRLGGQLQVSTDKLIGSKTLLSVCLRSVSGLSHQPFSYFFSPDTEE